MLAAGIVVFREVLEAALIIGVVLAATTGVARSRRFIAGGVAGGIVGAVVIAAFADRLSQAFAGSGQELFNAVVLLVAVAMLAWHTIWMQSHGRELARHMGEVGAAVGAGTRPLSVLAVVVGTAVLREGAETVLFLYGISAGSPAGAAPLLAGGALGLGAGALVGGLLYLGLLRIPSRHLFTVTTTLITLLAAGLAAQAVTFLAAAGVIDRLGATVWDTSWLLSQRSLAGGVLHTLIGYMDRPTTVQLGAYLLTLAVIVGATRLVARRGKAAS